MSEPAPITARRLLRHSPPAEKAAFLFALRRLRRRLSQPAPSVYGHYVAPETRFEHGGKDWNFPSRTLLRVLGAAPALACNYYLQLGRPASDSEEAA